MSQTQRPVILIVDDMPTNIHVLAETLRSEYQIRVAKDGQTALELAHRDDKPDLILLDVMMLVMDGYEVCRRLRESEITKNIPVILVTARNDTEDEEYGLRLGAVDYNHQTLQTSHCEGTGAHPRESEVQNGPAGSSRVSRRPHRHFQLPPLR